MKFVILLAFVFVASAQAPARDHTGDLGNGRWWAKLSDTFRLGYVVGFNEQRMSSGCDRCIWFKGPTLYREIVRGIDRFYGEPANRLIPVPAAIFDVAETFNRVPTDEVQRAIESQRWEWADIESKEQH